MLLCIELLSGDMRYASDIHEAQEKISEIHEVQDEHVRTEEQRRFEREKQEMIETFQVSDFRSPHHLLASFLLVE
jgi:CHASE3 domain sensor protein